MILCPWDFRSPKMGENGPQDAKIRRILYVALLCLNIKVFEGIDVLSCAIHGAYKKPRLSLNCGKRGFLLSESMFLHNSFRLHYWIREWDELGCGPGHKLRTVAPKELSEALLCSGNQQCRRWRCRSAKCRPARKKSISVCWTREKRGNNQITHGMAKR